MKQTVMSILSVVVGLLFSGSCLAVEPNAIYYTTIDDSMISIDNAGFSAMIVEHTYNNGKGVIVLQDGVVSIADKVFSRNENITSVTIPNSVTTIGDMAFAGCSSLTSVTIPDSVTTIGYAAFYNCGSLTSVTIGDSVTTIGDEAFYSCSSLTSITIPDSVTTIGYYAFYRCSSLTSVTIPNSVTMIGGYAFAGCDSLTSVTIPDSVTTIGEEAFRDCSSLTSIYCKATTPPALALNYDGDCYAFYYNASGRKIYVPMESVEAYKSAEWWSDYASDIVGYNF